MDHRYPRSHSRRPNRRGQDQLVVEVVRALAEADRLDLEEVEYTLYEYVNPEVLSALADYSSGSWEFTFEVADHDVRITSDGRLYVDGVLCRTDLALEGSSRRVYS